MKNIDRSDLGILCDVYWEVEDSARKKEAEALSRIYYACESAIKEGCLEERVVSLHTDADLAEEDTVKMGDRTWRQSERNEKGCVWSCIKL